MTSFLNWNQSAGTPQVSNLPADNDPLTRFLVDLRSPHAAARDKAAQSLRLYVEAEAREMSSESFTKYMTELNKRIMNLVNSSDPNETLGAIAIIDELIDVPYEENDTKILRFVNYLRMVFQQAGESDEELLRAAAKALGHLARAGGTLTTDTVDLEVRRALEWLEADRSEQQRHAAVLILKELAENTPTLFNLYVGQFLDNIWASIWDPQTTLRNSSVDALRSCLILIAKRDPKRRVNWYNNVYTHIQQGLKADKPESIHGSLLAIGEMMSHSKDFILRRYSDVSDSVLKYCDYRDSAVREAVLSLLPKLAACSVKPFVMGYLDTCLRHIITTLQNSNAQRDAAYIALGELAVAVGQSIVPSLDMIMSLIKKGLDPIDKKLFSLRALTCLSMVARAAGPQLTPHPMMKDLIDQMFLAGLSPILVESLTELTKNIPELLPAVQQHLLESIKTNLAQSPTPQQIEAPTAARRSSIQVLNVYRSGAQTGRVSIGNTNASSAEEEKLVLLALTTLGTFPFENTNLSPFLTEYVLDYLDNNNVEIRKQAAQTCVKVFEFTDEKGIDTDSISEVLERLLVIGISDPDSSIRRTILASLAPRFDQYLSQADHLHSLFVTLNDEDFEVRSHAITVIGRLARHRPAHVMPFLRKLLVQLLTRLEFDTDSRNKEESAILLGHLIDAAEHLVKPYLDAIYKVLLPLTSNSEQGVASGALATIGKLADIGQRDMIKYQEELLRLIVHALQQKNSPVRTDIALNTLGRLISATGHVVKPYEQHPNLLPLILSTLKGGRGIKGRASWAARLEAVKTLGILGAYDPWTHKMNQLKAKAKRTTAVQPQQHVEQQAVAPVVPRNRVEPVTLGAGAGASSLSVLPQTITTIAPRSDEYYPSVAINALVRILREPGLAQHHNQVVSAIMFVFNSMGKKCVPFLSQVVPVFIHAARSYDDSLKVTVFNQLSELVSIVREDIRPHLPQILGMFKDLWDDQKYLVKHILPLIEKIAGIVQNDFQVHLSDLTPQMLAVLYSDRSETRAPTLKVLHALLSISDKLHEFSHIVIPAIMYLIEQHEAPIRARETAIFTIGRLCCHIDFSSYASRVIHPLIRSLRNAHSSQLKNVILNSLCSIAITLEKNFAMFIKPINKVLEYHKFEHQAYKVIVSKLVRGKPLTRTDLPPDAESKWDEWIKVEANADRRRPDTVKLTVSQVGLKKVWSASQLSTQEDWVEWMRGFSIELLKNSPSPALRTCCILAQKYVPLARELFNAAFVSCWDQLEDQYQDDLVMNLQIAFSSGSIPAEVIQTLLNLAEFMEHNDKPIPIDAKTLGNVAEKVHAYAKALHYKEVEFYTSPQTSIEPLISINNQLEQPEAAVGILDYAKQHYSHELKEEWSIWYEKLQRWEDALEAYERKQLESKHEVKVTLGRMRCLRALGEWERLEQLSYRLWITNSDDNTRRQVAPFASYAAWQLGRWDSMEQYINAMEDDRSESVYLRAVLAAHRGQFGQARKHIARTRQLLDLELTALVGESYNRAYRVIIQLQQMTELEEVIAYKESANPQQKSHIKQMWTDRLKGCQRNVDVWQQILAIRSIVVSPQEDIETWLKFSSICRKSGRVALSLKVLTSLLGMDPNAMVAPRHGSRHASLTLPVSHPEVSYAYLKHLWAAGFENEAFRRLHDLVQRVKGESSHLDGGAIALSPPELSALLAKCHLKLGQWQLSLNDELNDSTIMPSVLASFKEATQLDKQSYKIWHQWAVTNFRVIQQYKQGSEQKMQPRSKEQMRQHLVPAIRGFFKSISLAGDQGLQDILRLLTLWFTHGAIKEVQEALEEGFNTISIDTWLTVIPQIIARIDTPLAPVRRLIHELLCKIGEAHPQALIYPLTVASKSQAPRRKAAAISIMNNLRQHSGSLVDQALLVSEELIKTAILWYESWHEGLEEASRQWFGQRNVDGMIAKLMPLHEMMDSGAHTMREIAFQQAFGRDLQEAREWMDKYKTSKLGSDLNQAWDLYCGVFRKINEKLPQIMNIELQYSSPKLLKARDLELAVPGTYHAGHSVVKIAWFAQSMRVIESKQRPRKLSIIGSDGLEYEFLLKGHEDLRQDERVMQLFGLVNTLLANDRDTTNKDLRIRGYSVIPLAPNSGLIQWLGNCDTLHDLIKEYRNARKVLLNVETRLMMTMAPKYESLTLLQKVEVFEHALSNTTGQDLYQVLWLKSRDSEVWLDRRTNYTRSLAVMSMVGYILGLGDRHPCNLMLDRTSGKIIHIDFGDCFEVAMNRDKFPEKIPFRLTRMLVNAMEVSKIEGNFRSTCENVMRVLRENKESVMAVLEAFVYDPLINWRLLHTPKEALHGSVREDGRVNVELEVDLDSQAIARSMVRMDRQSSYVASDTGSSMQTSEVLNDKALQVLSRVESKLRGRDFGGTQALGVPAQVQKLIRQATSVPNLCQCYIGWCPFW